ncbi:hypothetical protein [Legionella sp. 227]|uniref:hypothetical protein n=1 Tax=Legionella sp. 227 TaxID=3367288 RepID=UPI00370DA6B4
MTDSKLETSNNGVAGEARGSTTPEMIAKAACAYSRSFILKGSSQLVNNTYDQAQRVSLFRAILDLRALCSEYPGYRLEINEVYQEFHFTIQQCKKFSLGNCYEMALMALDYVLQHASPSVNAEVYEIEGGDHAFLVVGRKKNSHPKQPETWGEDAVICDPWSNEVYPASEYLAQTKNFYEVIHNGDYSNCVEKFDNRRHKLSPIPWHNTEYLRTINSRPHLDKIIELFHKKMTLIINALEKLEGKLHAIVQRLAQEYPDNPEKKVIIERMVNQLHTSVDKIKEDINKDCNTLPYEVLRSTLEKTWRKSIRSFQESVAVSEADKSILKKYNHEDSWRTQLLRFFNILPKTARDTSNALHEAQKQIEKTLKK